MSSILHDARLALRLAARSPTFTTVAVVSLALALAANTVVFSLVDGILLRPPPVEDPGSLVSLHALDAEGGRFHAFSYPDYRDLRDGVTAFDDVLAYDLAPLAWSVGDRAAVAQGYVASSNFFALLGVHAALGRTFDVSDGPRGGDAAAGGNPSW